MTIRLIEESTTGQARLTHYAQVEPLPGESPAETALRAWNDAEGDGWPCQDARLTDALAEGADGEVVASAREAMPVVGGRW